MTHEALDLVHNSQPVCLWQLFYTVGSTGQSFRRA
jgi:hypothetical protein